MKTTLRLTDMPLKRKWLRWRPWLAIIAAALLLLLQLEPSFAGRRVALIIGNGAYENVPELPNPPNDAEDVDAALRQLGFETVVGIDLDQAGMRDAEVRFTRLAREADVALFYYSGHAMQFSGVNYLMPVDAMLEDEADLLRFARVDDFVADLQQAENLSILVLDSCRDNPLAENLKRSIRKTRSTFEPERGLARIDSPQGMIVAFSTQAGRTALDGEDRNSPFTKAFLNHIGKPEEIGLVFRSISEEVFEETGREQLPELSLSIVGRFYLGGEPQAATPPREDKTGGRLELALIAEDPASAAGAPLRDFGNPDTNYAIERSITFPGDIARIGIIAEPVAGAALDIEIDPAALDRINRETDLVGRQIALVLDGRTVLSAATLREPLGGRLMLTGNFTLEEIQRLVGAITAGR